ncbi:MAG: hypothetical protein LBE13_09615, partial [Bacteroidales bacterium]|nr:hypothetical protein [Bacteroidales bacterium]
MKIIVYVAFCSVLFICCKKIETLKRDNPLDEKNEANMINEIALKFNSYSIYSENNNDGIISKGETVKLRISLKNVGKKDAKSVKVSFSITNSQASDSTMSSHISDAIINSYVSGFSPTTQINYGNISANGIKWADYNDNNSNTETSVSYSVQFTVSDSTPVNTQIPISISMVDENNNTWIDSFNIVIKSTGVNIIYNSYSIVSDNNNDDIINKGETVYLSVILKNNGTSTAKSVKATFSTTSSYVSSFTPIRQISYGDISAGSTQSGSYNYVSGGGGYYTIQFTVSNATPNNT